MRYRLPLLAVIVAALWAAPSALADTSSSSNWAGYAVHRSGVTFRKVFGIWKQPTLTCTQGTSSYSAYWVGLGGYSTKSNALEQIGTEADCNSRGRSRMSAWYELVPAPSRGLRLSVHAGDIIGGIVTAVGHTVTLTLDDRTTHRSVTKRLHASVVDVSSAEWIAEAPSECSNENSCKTLALADFGSTDFDFSGAETSTDYASGISSRKWQVTKITLVAGGQRFVGYHPGGESGRATPSRLLDKGTAFSITYSAQTGGGGGPMYASDIRSGYLKHPSRR